MNLVREARRRVTREMRSRKNVRCVFHPHRNMDTVMYGKANVVEAVLIYLRPQKMRMRYDYLRDDKETGRIFRRTGTWTAAIPFTYFWVVFNSNRLVGIHGFASSRKLTRKGSTVSPFPLPNINEIGGVCMSYFFGNRGGYHIPIEVRARRAVMAYFGTPFSTDFDYENAPQELEEGVEDVFRDWSRATKKYGVRRIKEWRWDRNGRFDLMNAVNMYGIH